MATQKNVIHTELLATDNTSVPTDKAAASIARFDKQAQKANKQGLRMMRGGLGQLGHQVQDVAVQLQMGQNAMLVFGQQGSQIASLMGPNGAIIGAVLAVGAAIGTSLAPALFNTRKHLEEFQEVITNVARVMNVDAKTGVVSFTEEIVKLGQKSEELAKGKLELALVDAILSVETASDGAKQAIEEFNIAMGRQGNLLIASSNIKTLADDMGIAESSAKKLAEAALAVSQGGLSEQAFAGLIIGISNLEDATTDQIQEFNRLKQSTIDNVVNMMEGADTVKNLTDLQDNFNRKLFEGSDTYKEANKSVEQFLGSIEKQTETLGLTKAQSIAYTASLHDLTTAQHEIVVASIEKILAHETEIERVKKLKQLQTDFTKSMLSEVQSEINARKELAKARKTAQDELTAALDKEQKNRERQWAKRELSQTDSILLPDSPYTTEEREQIQTYRAALRNPNRYPKWRDSDSKWYKVENKESTLAKLEENLKRDNKRPNRVEFWNECKAKVEAL